MGVEVREWGGASRVAKGESERTAISLDEKEEILLPERGQTRVVTGP